MFCAFCKADEGPSPHGGVGQEHPKEIKIPPPPRIMIIGLVVDDTIVLGIRYNRECKTIYIYIYVCMYLWEEMREEWVQDKAEAHHGEAEAPLSTEMLAT